MIDPPLMAMVCRVIQLASRDARNTLMSSEAPASRSTRAMPRPTPRPAPVTSAVLPVRFEHNVSYFYRLGSPVGSRRNVPVAAGLPATTTRETIVQRNASAMIRATNEGTKGNGAAKL